MPATKKNHKQVKTLVYDEAKRRRPQAIEVADSRHNRINPYGSLGCRPPALAAVTVQS